MAGNRRIEKRYLEFREMRWRVPNGQWGEYVRRGLFERISQRVARLRSGVDLVWEDGRHVLRDKSRRLEVSIPSSWQMVERAALFKTSGLNLTPQARQREIQAQYGRTFEPWTAS